MLTTADGAATFSLTDRDGAGQAGAPAMHVAHDAPFGRQAEQRKLSLDVSTSARANLLCRSTQDALINRGTERNQRQMKTLARL